MTEPETPKTPETPDPEPDRGEERPVSPETLADVAPEVLAEISPEPERPCHTPLDVLTQVHETLDARLAELAAKHDERMQCGRGCFDCCVDELTVFEVEAALIQRDYPELLEQGRPHPVGRCAFLDSSGACRIYDRRPYVCRTQGLPLRWLAETAAGETVELRDICPLNAEGPALETLDREDCWSLGPLEEVLAGIQVAVDGGEGRRVALRDLFEREPDPEGAARPAGDRGSDSAAEA